MSEQSVSPPGLLGRQNISGRVTSADVARLAGVSQSAVSRVFTDGAALNRERVLRGRVGRRCIHHLLATRVGCSMSAALKPFQPDALRLAASSWPAIGAIASGSASAVSLRLDPGYEVRSIGGVAIAADETEECWQRLLQAASTDKPVVVVFQRPAPQKTWRVQKRT